MAASNASVSQCSTVGGQSLSISVPHAYVGPREDMCEDVFTSVNLIPQVVDAAQLAEQLTVRFREEGYYVPEVAVVEAGVPLDGADRALASLLQ